MLSRSHQLMATAVIACLSLTACGKKKTLYAEPTATVSTSGDADTSKAPTASNDQQKTEPQLGGGLGSTGGTGDLPQPPTISEPSTPDLPPAPVVPSEPSVPSTPVTPSIPSVNEPAPAVPPTSVGNLPTPPVVETVPAPSAPIMTNTIPDYNPGDFNNLGRDGFTKRLTGGVTQDGLLYTSSSTDGLLDFLRLRLDNADFNSRRLNMAAASAIVSAVMGVDKFSNDAAITLKVLENDQVRVYNLVGALNNGGPAAKLSIVRSANGQTTTGLRGVEGTLKCLDLDGGCENSVARLRVGAQGAGAIVYVVFRQSQADMHFSLPANHSNNAEYLALRAMMYNTANRAPTKDRVTQTQISSWEVVNGRSGFSVWMKTGGNELLGFAGPLLAPEAGSGVNIPLSRLAKDKEDSLSLISLNNTRLDYQNWLSEARLVANNGLGQVRIALKMRQRATYAQDVFSIIFMRNIKPLVEINDDNLK